MMWPTSWLLVPLFCVTIDRGASGTVTSGLTSREALRGIGSSFVRSLSFRHRLRVCHAYPYDQSLDVYVDRVKVTEAPIAYKTCVESGKQLQPGDKIDFRVGDASVGTFSVSELPSNDAVLLVAIYRHDAVSTAVSFESHVFADLKSAQLAVIDTYRGAAKATTRIMDATDEGTVGQSEQLRYSSVVALNPGVYDILLQGSDGETKAMQELVAVEGESYVALRCGIEAKTGPSFPQDIMIFPVSEKQVAVRERKQAKERSAALAHPALRAIGLWTLSSCLLFVAV